jgi:hypothetical protein
VNPDERIAVLEVEVRELKSDLGEIKSDLKKLVAAANMAGGAWQATMKIGGLLVIIASAFYGVITLLLSIMKWLGKGG